VVKRALIRVVGVLALVLAAVWVWNLAGAAFSLRGFLDGPDGASTPPSGPTLDAPDPGRSSPPASERPRDPARVGQALATTPEPDEPDSAVVSGEEFEALLNDELASEFDAESVEALRRNLRELDDGQP
jgi:hypothetical protein